MKVRVQARSKLIRTIVDPYRVHSDELGVMLVKAKELQV